MPKWRQSSCKIAWEHFQRCVYGGFDFSLYWVTRHFRGRNQNFVKEIQAVAEKFQLAWTLSGICTNLLEGDSLKFVNPSIGTWLNDNTVQAAKKLFLNKPFLSDLKFCVEGTRHRWDQVVKSCTWVVDKGIRVKFAYEPSDSSGWSFSWFLLYKVIRSISIPPWMGY